MRPCWQQALASVVSFCLFAGAQSQPPQSGKPRSFGVRNAGGKADINVIQHIIFIVKENRSFDSMFGTMSLTRPEVNGSTSGLLSTGQVVPTRG